MNIKALDSELKDDGSVFLAYDGFLTQALIVAMTEALEKESQMSATMRTNILTIFIELSQNMMNYSKSQDITASHNDGRGMIVVGHDKEKDTYYVMSRNLISKEDKERIDEKLKKILSLNKDELRSYYRQMRKTGHEKHEQGAGIGFIEIARRCEEMVYSFEEVGDRYRFILKATLKNESVSNSSTQGQ